jgi:formate dehydrogenase major subunit
VIDTQSYFREYVVNYTNASTIVNKSFRDTEDLDGVFSGYDPETGRYDSASWMYGGCQVGVSPGVHEHSTQAFSEHTGAGMLMGEVERTRRSSTRGASFRSYAGTSPAIRPRWCSGSAGSRARTSWRWRMH